MPSTKLSTSEIFGKSVDSARSPADLFSFANTGQQPLHRQHYCRWGDSDDRLSLPLAIRPAQDDAESLFADVATYFPNFSPVTAYIHVLDKRIIGLLKKDSGEVIPKAHPNEIKTAIGLIVGELLTTSETISTRSEGITYSAAKRTLSFAVFRAIALYRHASVADLVTERWFSARATFGMESSADQAAALLWMIKLQAGSPPRTADNTVDPFQSVLSKVITGQQKTADLRDVIAVLMGALKKPISQLSGPFDDRASAFIEIAQFISTNRPTGEFGSICLGFFCNEILPGSLSHFKLLTPILHQYPTAMMWYGLFGSLSDDFDWRNANSGLGLKLMRDLLRPYSLDQRPSCDVAYDELDVLSRLTLKPEILKPVQSKSCSIAILPGVEISVRFDSSGSAKSIIPDDGNLIENLTMQDSRLLSILSEAVEIIGARNAKMPKPRRFRRNS